jgi:hypothetical protein
MYGRYHVSAQVAALSVALIILCVCAVPLQAYRDCTFKGVVVDHGWRSMTVKSGSQCAEVNVGWRTQYIPNRRPCLGERVAVDFTLEDGYMKATKVVSLSPLPPSVQCYPPPPPSSAVCREVGGERAAVESCVPSRPICSTRPPAYVTGKWTPTGKPEAAKPAKKRKPVAEAPKPPEKEEKIKATEKEKEEPTPYPGQKTITGEVVASSPQSISLRVMEEGEAAEVVNVKVGLKTKFIPFRRPAVGEKVQVDYRQENGEKFGYTVKVIQ